MNLNEENGRPLTWVAFAKDTGEPVMVDDRTFSEDHHVRERPDEKAKRKGRAL